MNLIYKSNVFPFKIETKTLTIMVSNKIYTYKEFKFSFGPSNSMEARHIHKIVMNLLRQALSNRATGCEKQVLLNVAVQIAGMYNLESFCDYANPNYTKLKKALQGLHEVKFVLEKLDERFNVTDIRVRPTKCDYLLKALAVLNHDYERVILNMNFMRCKKQMAQARKNITRPTILRQIAPNRIIKTAKISTPNPSRSHLYQASPFTSTPVAPFNNHSSFNFTNDLNDSGFQPSPITQNSRSFHQQTFQTPIQSMSEFDSLLESTFNDHDEDFITTSGSCFKPTYSVYDLPPVNSSSYVPDMGNIF